MVANLYSCLEWQYLKNHSQNQGCSRGMEIIILIDIGSAHNFLNTKTVEYLHCVREEDRPMQVCVTDGYKMICTKRYKTFE